MKIPPPNPRIELIWEMDYLLVKTRLDEAKFNDLQDDLLENVFFVSNKGYDKRISRGIELMRDVDIKDAPFLAIDLALNLDDIWSDNKHLTKQSDLKIFMTRQVIDIMRTL